MNAEPLRLTAADRDSPLWRALSAHINRRRDNLRAQNDTSQSIEQTERLRGGIAELTALLDLAVDRQATRRV